MRKKTSLAAALALVMGSSYAQSSVTLFGSLSTGVDFVNNVSGGHRYPTDDGNFVPNMLGMTGSEDLGGGLQAVFKLVSVYIVSTGSLPVPGDLFKFQSYIGLQSNTYGQLTMGNQTGFDLDYLGTLSNAWAGSFLASHPGNIDEMANLFQFQNAIKYVSPAYKGLSFGAMLGLGNHAGSFAQGRNYAFGAHYENGPIVLGASYEDENNRYLEGASFIGLPELLGTPITPNVALVADNVKNIGVGGSYLIGTVCVRALFTQTRLTKGAQFANINNFDLGGTWQTTAANALHFGAGVSRIGSDQWDTLILNDAYSLSKRTTVYATVLIQAASGPGAVASLVSAGQASGSHQVALALGIQHWF